MAESEYLRHFTEAVSAYLQSIVKQNENDIQAYKEALKQYLNENRADLLDPEKYTVKTYPAELRPFINRSIKSVGFESSTQFINKFNGDLIVVCPKEHEHKLDMLDSKIMSSLKSFNIDHDELQKGIKGGDSIITTEPYALTDTQLFYLLPQLAEYEIPYCVNNDNSFSYPESQKSKVNMAINACTAEMVSSDYARYEKIFAENTKLRQSIADKLPNLKDGEAIYISSENRAGNNYISLLKIDKDSISEINMSIDNLSETHVREVYSKPVDINDLTYVYRKVSAFSNPVMLDNSEYQPEYFHAVKNAVSEKTNDIYGKYERSEFDKDLTRFLKENTGNIRFTSASKAFKDIDDFVNAEDEGRIQERWNKLKATEPTPGLLSAQLTKYVNLNSFMKEQVVNTENNRKEQPER